MSGTRYSGRKPKPTTIGEGLRGRPGNRVIPKPPDYLTDDGKACWRRVVKVLKDCGLIERADADSLALYCTAYQRWLEAEAGIKKHGMLIKNKDGYPVRSPLLAIAQESMSQMIKLLTEFGMTPASRCRIPAAPDSAPPPRRVVPYKADPRQLLEESLN